MRLLPAVFALAFLASLLFAADPTLSLKASLSELCSGITSLLPVAAMLMVAAGAVTYVSGQVMGAETRARANTWATAMLVGAVMSLAINAIAPPLLQAVYGNKVSCTGGFSSTACGVLQDGLKCCNFGGGNCLVCSANDGCGTNGACDWNDGSGNERPAGADIPVACASSPGGCGPLPPGTKCCYFEGGSTICDVQSGCNAEKMSCEWQVSNVCEYGESAPCDGS